MLNHRLRVFHFESEWLADQATLVLIVNQERKVTARLQGMASHRLDEFHPRWQCWEPSLFCDIPQLRPARPHIVKIGLLLAGGFQCFQNSNHLLANRHGQIHVHAPGHLSRKKATQIGTRLRHSWPPESKVKPTFSSHTC